MPQEEKAEGTKETFVTVTAAQAWSLFEGERKEKADLMRRFERLEKRYENLENERDQYKEIALGKIKVIG